MPISRKIIDWTKSALPAVASWLIESHTTGDATDLSNVLLVVPGARAGRRLQELLVDEAERASVILQSPEIVTQGALPERLYVEQKPFADNLTQHLAWIAALKQISRETLEPYFPRLPQNDDFLAWLPFAEMLAALHRELAADSLHFGDVVTRGSELDNFPEEARWQVLREIQKAYLVVLDKLNLWDRQSARLFAIENDEPQTDQKIVLIGTVDMNLATRQMLDRVADAVTAVIFAREEHAERFDAHGCLIPRFWPWPLVDLDDNQIRIVSHPGDQADEVLRALGDLQGEFPAEEIIVGVPDTDLIPYIEQRIESAGHPTRNGIGRTGLDTLLGSLLKQLASWLEEKSASEFQNLLRHPLIEAYLTRRDVTGDWLTAVDLYRGNHLQSSIGADWLGKQDDYDREVSEKSYKAIRELLKEWEYAKLPLTEWTSPLIVLLSEICDEAKFSSRESRELNEVTNTLRQSLEKLSDVPGSLVPDVGGSGLLRMLLDDLAQTPIPPEVDPAAVELLGWLELPWDDSEVLIVTGMNEGIVPSSRNADLFLPNHLRSLLQIEDNDRRYARDAYALSLLQASRSHLTLIAGRKTATNDPLIPSRLLFGDNQKTVVERTLRFFKEEETSRPVPGKLAPGEDQIRFQPPQLEPYYQEVTSMRVTEFKDYLQCPYRYFLRHRLKLKSTIPNTDELDPLAFGNVLHEVLERFGLDEEIRHATEPKPIVAFLNSQLDSLMRAFYGSDPEPAIRLQTERLRSRLHAFAIWQAQHADAGWQIEYIEHTVAEEDGVTLVVPGEEPMNLRGRIDRIDLNVKTGERRIYDYKSSDSAKSPQQTHYKPKKHEWIDLQLPLYRHLIASLGITENIELGYINLPKKLDDVKDYLAPWNAEVLLEADEQAAQIVRDIRDNRFWPPSDDPGLLAEFSEICLDTILGASDDDEGEDE